MASKSITFDSLHSDLIETHLLSKFDGPSLASLSSTSQFLNNLCNKENLWEDICNSTWNSIKHPLIRQIISSFPGGYRSFYSDSFPILHANSSRASPRDLGAPLRESSVLATEFSDGNLSVTTTKLISAVDLHYGNNQVYSNVKVTNTDEGSFPGSLFGVDLIKPKETVEIPLKYQGDDKNCMSNLEKNLTLSWIVIDPTLKRSANVSSLRPVSVHSNRDGNGMKVTYATILSGNCLGIDTTEFVECRIVAIFGCEEGTNIELRQLSLCLVDMVRSRLNGEMSLRILKEAMESGERRKENGKEKEMYVKYLNFERQRFIIWIFFAISLITWLGFA